MDEEKFVACLEQYYGEYPNAYIRKCVISFLREKNFTTDSIRNLLRHVYKTYSTQWKNTPDICIVEKAIGEVNKLAEVYCGFSKLEHKSTMLNCSQIEEKPMTEEEKQEAHKKLQELCKKITKKA